VACTLVTKRPMYPVAPTTSTVLSLDASAIATTAAGARRAATRATREACTGRAPATCVRLLRASELRVLVEE